jgi:Ca2+-transporting ATPase
MLAGAPWYSRPVEDVAAALQVDTTIGLPAGEVAARLERHGPNRLPRQPPPGPLSLLLRQFTSLLVYILLFAAGLSLALGDWLEFAAIIVIAVFNGVLGFVQEHRAEQALSALESLSVPTATVLRDGASQTVATEDVVPGDVLLLEEGDIVAADARLIAAIALSANEALLTGESVPVDKVVEARPAPTPLAEQNCLVFQGTQIARGRGRAIAVRTGASSEMGRIASNVLAQPQEETPLQHELHRVGRVLAIAAGVLCLGVFIIGIARGIDTDKMLLTAASLGVAAIPEGLPAASTVVLALGVQRMASRNALVRRLSSVETLGSVTMVFTDKTGTLTQNRMRVEETWLAGSERDFLNVARFCNNAELAEKSDAHRGDPTEIALLDYVKQHDGPSYSSTGYERRLEMPFTADRARMTVVMELPDGAALLVFTKGATGRVLERCSLVGASPATDELRRQVTDRASEMARSGLRVLALAQRALHEEASDAEQIETGLTLVGLAGMADPLRPEAKEAVRRAQEAGIQVVMLTGDQRETAASIGTAVGIEGEIATGGELDQLGPDHLPARLSATRIFARVTSDHKLQIIRAARREGHVVAMTGDGVNDAPALRAADIGIAMGIQGTPAAREASDLVLADDNFATIVAAIEEGRTIHANIRRFIHFLLACNTAEIAVVFLLLAWAVDPSSRHCRFSS